MADGEKIRELLGVFWELIGGSGCSQTDGELYDAAVEELDALANLKMLPSAIRVAHMQTDAGHHGSEALTRSFCCAPGPRYYLEERPMDVMWCHACAKVWEEKCGRPWPHPGMVEMTPSG